MTDKIFYNFPIAIFRQVRTDTKDRILFIEDTINQAIRYALFAAYKKRMPPQSNPNEYNEGVFNSLMEEMGFTVDYDHKKALQNYAEAYWRHRNNRVFVGVDKDLLFDFRDNLVYKTDFEIIQFLAFLAIRSIIGAGHYNMRVKHIPWPYVLSRMAGHEKKVSDINRLPKFISQYASKRLRVKLINALCERWHMQYYGKYLGKGRPPLFTFSTSIDLAAVVEAEKQQKRASAGTIHADAALDKATHQMAIIEPEQVEPLPPVPGMGGNNPGELW